jgi:hypothetical protein
MSKPQYYKNLRRTAKNPPPNSEECSFIIEVVNSYDLDGMIDDLLEFGMPIIECKDTAVFFISLGCYVRTQVNNETIDLEEAYLERQILKKLSPEQRKLYFKEKE